MKNWAGFIFNKVASTKFGPEHLGARQRTGVLAAHLGSLDTGHVLLGQAGTVQGLLRVLSVALEHLRLQLRADRRGVACSVEDREEVHMSSPRWRTYHSILASFLSAARAVKHCGPWVPAAGSGMHTGL